MNDLGLTTADECLVVTAQIVTVVIAQILIVAAIGAIVLIIARSWRDEDAEV